MYGYLDDHDRVVVADGSGAILFVGHHRTADGWRISATGYDRTFEATGTLSGAGLTVTPGPAITFTAPAPE